MDYEKAAGIRKKGLAGLITENLVEGQGLGSSFGSAISDRTKATFTGIQEKFDPLNIVKTLTGGSNLAAAVVGRLTGRNKSSLKYFAGNKKPSPRGVNFETGESLSDPVMETLGLIYEELKLAEEDRKLINQTQKSQEQDREKEENKRNEALIEAISARRKMKETPKEKAQKKKKEVQKKTKEKKSEQDTKKKDTEKKTETKKEKQETKKEKVTKETVDKKKETAQKVEDKKVETKKKAEEVTKPEVKPEVKPTPKPEKVPKVEKAPKVEKVPTEKPKLGKVSGKYESGTKGVAAISGGMGGKDPGGISYGKYQLATKTGTMAAFLASTEAKAFSEKFKGLQPGTPEFNEVYRKVAAEDPVNFGQAQHDYIERTLYKPVQDFAAKSGFDTSNPAVAEALFSQSVQHGLGGNKKIITNAATIAGPNSTTDEQVRALYKSRSDYVSGLNLDAKVKAGILKRYEDESKDVLRISQENADLKAETRKDNRAVQNIVNNTSITQSNTLPPTKREKENDRPAILEKGRG